jgi:hypothetical protein
MAGVDIGLPQPDPHREGRLSMDEITLDPALQVAVCMPLVDGV